MNFDFLISRDSSDGSEVFWGFWGFLGFGFRVVVFSPQALQSSVRILAPGKPSIGLCLSTSDADGNSAR